MHCLLWLAKINISTSLASRNNLGTSNKRCGFNVVCNNARVNHSLKLRHPGAKLFIYYSFFVRAVKRWNAPLKEIPEGNTFNILKIKLGKFLDISFEI